MNRVRLNVSLYVGLVLIACLAFGLALMQQNSDSSIGERARHVLGKEDDDGANARLTSAKQGVVLPKDHDGNDLHTSVLQAAMAQAMAFINVDHTEVEAYNEKVLAGATGGFAEQYQKTVPSLTKLTKQYKTVMTGKVVSAGVVAADQESATVLVAMEGTVTNTDTPRPQANAPRLKLELVWEGGRWLTSDLVFVP